MNILSNLGYTDVNYHIKFLTIGIKSIDKDKFIEPKNNNFVKPTGGLWASPYTPGNMCISPWYEWCSYEMPHWIENHGVVFELKDNAKVLVINSKEDLKKTFEKYKYDSDIAIFQILDFEKIAQDYDCIYLTARGEMVTRFSHDYTLYGWDVESLLVLNIDCVINSYKINIDLPEE